MFSEKKNDDNIATLSAVSKVTSKKYLDETGLGHLSSLIISFVRNYAAPKTHNHDGSYAAKSHAHTTAQVTGLDSALAGKAQTGHNHDGVYAKTAHTHSTDNITSGVLPIGRGGTGGTSATAANYNILSGIPASTVDAADTDKFVVMHTSPTTSTGRLITKTAAQMWAWIKSKTDPLYATRTHNHDSAYAAKSHNHDAGNITSGVLPIGRGGTGAGTADAALKNLMDNCTIGGTAAPSDDLWYFTSNLDAAQPPVKRKHSALWSYIKSKTDPLYQPRGSYAASSHTHSIANITNLQSQLDGKAAVSHGHSAVTTSAAGFMSAADKSKLDGIATGANKTIVDSSLSSTSVNPVQNKVVNSALAGKASTSHTHTTAQVSGLDAALAGKASTSHNHTIAQVTNLQTELDKKQVKIQPVTTAGTGSAYTATVSHIKALTAGVEFTMIPNVVSTTISPTLNVNGLGAKQLRQRLSNSTQSTATGATDNWLAAGKPVNVMYDGAFWVVDFVRPNMTSAYGTLPVANGGTGCTNSSDAASHLIDSLAVGATTATDNDYLICQVPNSGTAHKRPMSVVWNWIKAKCDSIYQPKGSYAAASHSHAWSSITGKPTIPSALTYMPVGYVYISWSSTSPASLFGGSWTAITGRFPYFNAGTGTGGSNTHTLSVNEMPNHYHMQNVSNTGTDGWAQRSDYNSDSRGRSFPQGINTDGAGGGAAHNNMPAYQTLYAWRRTS